MRTTRMLAVVTLLAAAAVAAAGPVQAAPPPPPIEGYVWGDQPANPNYFPGTGYEFNSAGGQIQIIRNVVGSYHVRFAGMAGVGGVAHASAYGSNAVCAVNAFGPRLGDEWVHVMCFNPDGLPVDTRFIANVTNRQPAGASFGYLWNDNPVPPLGGHVPPADRSYDSAGMPIVVHHLAPGRYQVELGAFAADSGGPWRNGFLRATAYGSVYRHCQILDPAIVAVPSRIYISCFDDTGFNADTRFTLTYARGVSMLGAAIPHTSATVDQLAAPVVAGWTNSFGGAPVPVEIVAGSYRVSFPGAAAPRGHAMATIMGTPPAYCNIHSWWASGGMEHLWLRCYDGGVGVAAPAVLYNVGFLP